MAELKPCPFGCESDKRPTVDTMRIATGWTVRCDSCECEGPWAPTEAEAITVWNSRPAPAVDLEAAAEVLAEIRRAVAKFPTWPTDPLHALAVLTEEYGELGKAVLQQVYEPHKNNADDVRKEAIQTAAMALRFVASLDRYVYAQCEQHEQDRRHFGWQS